MDKKLTNVGLHVGTWADGHYEAKIRDDGGVIISTIFNDAKHTYTVSLPPTAWDRLVAWVEWQRKDKLIK